MMRERSVFPNYQKNNINNITPERKREVRQEIDYADEIAELKLTINFAIDQSPLRKDGESIKYVLERVWSTHCHLLTPEINFEKEEMDA
jgi:hypothetical protein